MITVDRALSADDPRQPARALTTRFLDFWLLGGASLVVWLALVSAQAFRTTSAVGQQFRNLEATTLSLALLINYPHFLLSYKLAYGRGWTFVSRHSWQLIAVPIGLAGLLASAYLLYDIPVGRLQAVTRLSEGISSWGVNAQILAGPRIGDLLLTLAFNLMVVTIGWHYTMQVFGCMMVYARFDGYALTPPQRTAIKWTLGTIWLMSVIENNLNGAFRAFGGFSYSSFDLPDALGPASQILVGIGLLVVGYQVFYVNYHARGQLPSLNLVVPFIALCVWWMPLTRQPEFYFLLVPLFHSLQYLPFAVKVEHNKLRRMSHREIRGTVVMIAIVLAGWLAFEMVPMTLDDRLGTEHAWGISFFVIAAMLFINIHHYFIDNVAWKMTDPIIRHYLLDETADRAEPLPSLR